MKLPVPALFQKKEDNEYYLSLLLRDEKIVAVILNETNGELHIKGRHEEVLATPLEHLSYETLLKTLDRTISKAEETLPPNVETEKTVFGVKDSWVEEKKIKKEHLSKLKKLCDSLSLQPIGFMVVSEAIANLLQKEEGAPVSGILAEIGKTHITLTLFRAGRAIQSHNAAIHDSLAKTVDRLLHHFTIDVLPSRIILFNGGTEERTAQEFIAHSWSKSLPFLHVPQISVLAEGFDGKAIVYGAAEQMGFTINSLGDTTVKELTATGTDEKHQHEKRKEKDTADEETETLDTSEAEGEKAQETHRKQEEGIIETENFGFVMGKDISSIMPHSPQKPHREEDTFSEEPHGHALQKRHHYSVDEPVEEEEEEEEEEDEGRSRKKSSILPFSLSSLPVTAILAAGKSAISKSISAVPLETLRQGRTGRVMILAPVVLIIFIALLLFYTFNVKASVILQMQPKQISEEEEITISIGSPNDFAQRILTAKEVEVELEGTASTNATGKKEIGEKAKGTVTLYNNGDSRRTIPAGTVLTSSNNMDFITEKEVAVASASGSIFTGTKPGTADVAVTAKSIGKEYNLPSNTEFKVAGTSSLAAKNSSAFSGGSKKEVTVVSKKDIERVTQELPKSLEAEARNKLKGSIARGESVLPIFTTVTLAKKNFDKDEGEEASKVTLKATAVFTTLSYADTELMQLAEASLKGRYSQNLALSEKGITTEVAEIEAEDEEEVTAVLKMNAGLLPKINTETLTKEITGKSFADASDYLTRQPQVKDAQIKLSPSIPFLPKSLPRFTKNISVILETNE